jgi:ABC-2 type transport system permease protein
VGALVPYPMPAAGANPFRGTPGSGGAAIIAQSVVGSVALLVAVPMVCLVVLGVALWSPLIWLTLPIGLALGGAALALSVRLGGRVIDLRGPEILAAVRRSS